MFVAKASSFFASHVPIHFGKIYILMVRSTSLLVPTRHRTPFLQLLMVKSSFGRAKNSFLLVLNPKLCSKMLMCLRVCLSYIVTVSIMSFFVCFFDCFWWIHHQQSTMVFVGCQVRIPPLEAGSDPARATRKMEDGKALERIGMDRGFTADLSSKIHISPGKMVSLFTRMWWLMVIVHKQESGFNQRSHSVEKSTKNVHGNTKKGDSTNKHVDLIIKIGIYQTKITNTCIAWRILSKKQQKCALGMLRSILISYWPTNGDT